MAAKKEFFEKARFGRRFAATVSLRNLKHETRRAIGAIVFLALALLFTLSGVGKGGVAGGRAYELLSYLLGVGYFLIPFLLFLVAISLGSEKEDEGREGHRIIGGVLFFLSGLTLLYILYAKGSGLVGRLLGESLVSLFDVYGSFIIAASFLLVSLLILFELPLGLRDGLKSVREIFSSAIGRWREKNKKTNGKSIEEIAKEAVAAHPTENNISADSEEKDVEAYSVAKAKRDDLAQAVFEEASSGRGKKEFPVLFTISREPFVPPPLSLLEGDRGRPGVGDIKANANIIKRTLQNFGIVVEMDEISIGPTVTRYALKPAEGVRLQKIVALQQNLELALAAHPVRIEAPIPGKSLVGIEVPNSIKSIVGLGSMLGSAEFQESQKSLFIALGRGISGESYFGNLAKMPHLLIAGATGSGKSVMIHSILTSLLYRNSPENLRLIMIDPKRVELTLYNKIPHLLHPVITDAKKAILALRWAAKEMERRYDILETESVRDVESYHKNILAPALARLRKEGKSDFEGESSAPEVMPYIIIVIDELADIMATFPRELEAAVVRLAQMSRAVGIHLILSTQRPSVNIITGLIKANVPARLALQVASQVDSRTILDMGGAEKLLGSGDMLYISADMAQPKRMQSPFITEAELKKVVAHLIKAGEVIPPNEINLGGENGVGSTNSSLFSDILESGEEEVNDTMYEEAREAVIKAGKASTSYLQRRLRIGYSRAARIMDMLEERGVIGPSDGSKPREILIKSEITEAGENIL